MLPTALDVQRILDKAVMLVEHFPLERPEASTGLALHPMSIPAS